MIRDEWKSLFLLPDAETEVPSPQLEQGSVAAAWALSDDPAARGIRLKLSNPTPVGREVILPAMWKPGRVELPPHGVVWVEAPANWNAGSTLDYRENDDNTRRVLAPPPVPHQQLDLILQQALPVFSLRHGSLKSKLLFNNNTGVKQTLKGTLVGEGSGEKAVNLEFSLHLRSGLRAETVDVSWKGPRVEGMHPVTLCLNGPLNVEITGGKKGQRPFSLRQPALLWVDTSSGELDMDSLRLDMQVQAGGQVIVELGLRHTGGQHNRVDLVWSQEDEKTPHWKLEALSSGQSRSETLMARIPVQRVGHLLRQDPNGWCAVLRHTDDDGVERQQGILLAAHAVQSVELSLPRLPLLGPCRLQVEPRKLEVHADGVNTGVGGLPDGFTISYSFPEGLSGEKRVGPWFRAPRAGRPIISGQTSFHLTYELKDWLIPRLSQDQRYLELQLKSCPGCTLEPNWDLVWMGDNVEGTDANRAVLSISPASGGGLSRISCHIQWGSRHWDARLLMYHLTRGDGTRFGVVGVTNLRDKT